ncbi:MAG: hypothetical protein ACYCQI_10340 [Gammaproteobacteria bacterium]
MNGRLAMPDLGASLRRGGEAFAHVVKDAIKVNANLYGEHGTPNCSLESLMRGCEFYSAKLDGGGDIFGLMFVSAISASPYLAYRVAIKDLALWIKNQGIKAVNDTYLATDEQIDATDNRHAIAKVLGVGGWVLGLGVRGAIYSGGLFGLSTFGYHRMAKAFKSCINFIFDAQLEVDSHNQQLAHPRNTIGAVLKHFNLVRLTNGLGYAITVGLGVLGLTVHSARFASRKINAITQKIFGMEVFTQSKEENAAYESIAPYSKERFARYGLLGLVGIALGGAITVVVKGLELAGRALGFSEYSGHTISRAFKRCANFVFDTNYDLLPHHEYIDTNKIKQPQTLSDRADRSWVGLNRVLNGFGYAMSFACGVLGFTVHSMRFARQNMNAISQAVLGTDVFNISDEERVAYHKATSGSKEWFARAGVLGLAGLALGGSITLALKGFELAGRGLLGISEYSGYTISRAFKRCSNFVFGTKYDVTSDQDYINRHKTKLPQTLSDRTSRSWISINRWLNGFGYAVSFACGVLGFTTHSIRFARHNLNALSQKVFATDIFAISDAEKDAYNAAASGSKEWFARAGALGLIGLGIGGFFTVAAKGFELTARVLGISEYSGYTISRAFKRCMNFIFGADCDVASDQNYIDQHKKKQPQMLADHASRSWVGVNRFMNGFGYAMTFACGVLGFTTHSMQLASRGVNAITHKIFGVNVFSITAEEAQAYAKVSRGSKEWFARAGILGLVGISLGGVFTVACKGIELAGRLLGISEYSGHTISRAFTHCVNFVFGTKYDAKPDQDYIDQHKARNPQTLSDRTSRSWIGLNRMLNGFGYVASLACGVLGLTAHSMRFARHYLNTVSQKVFAADVFTISDEEKKAYTETARGSKEWFARSGVLGLISLGVGSLAIGAVKVLDLTRRILGFSFYSGHTIARAFKRSANFVFGSNYDVQPDLEYISEHKKKQPQTLADRTSRSWIGLNRVINGFAHAMSFACGVLGLTIHSKRAGRRGINFITQSLFGKTVFKISDEERKAYDQTIIGSKEWFARAGGLGLVAITLSGIVTGLTKVGEYTGRLLGFSEYSGYTISRAFKRCANFVFGTNYDITPDHTYIHQHKTKSPQTLTDRTSRSWIGLNRVLNGFGYVASFACGALGFTVHSIRFARHYLNALSQKAFDTNVFAISDAERDAYNATILCTKEWFARGGTLGLGCLGVGGLITGAMKGLELTGRMLGISSYSGHTIARALKRCANFVFGANFDIKLNQDYIEAHKKKQTQTLSNRASRSWIGLNRGLNGFSYAVSFACGVLGFTTHSMQFARRGINLVSQKLFGANVFAIEAEEQKRYDETARWSKEWFARAGVFGLIGMGIGGVVTGLVKVAELTGRLLGVSYYSAHTISRAFKRCMNFIARSNYDISPDQDYINQHKARNPQTLSDRTSRTWIGFNRFLNGFGYAATFACGVLGLTAHCIGAARRGINAMSQAAFGTHAIQISQEERAAYEKAAPGSKEWFARAGLLGLGTLTVAGAFTLLAKGAELIGRTLGISTYSGHTIARAFKRCANFVFGTKYDVQPDQEYIDNHKKRPQTLSNITSRSWFGFNRLLNGFGYTASMVCGVLGFTTHSMSFARHNLNAVSQRIFGATLFAISADEQKAYNEMPRGSKEWFARGGVLGLIGIGAGALVMGVVKGLELTGRVLGISSYSGHTIARAFKRCANFVFGTNYDIQPHLDYINAHKLKQPQTLSDRASRSWIGLNRILNGFGYVMTATCGVLGLTAHSMRFMRNRVNAVSQKAFGVDVFTVSQAEKDSYNATPRGSKEWLARGGLLGLMGVGAGVVIAGVVKVADLAGRVLGISAYSGHTICRALKRCSNYVFGTNYDVKPHQDYINAHKAKPNPTLSDRASRSWIGLNRLVNGFSYAVSGVLGIFGFSAANYHRSAKEVKKIQNLFADDGKEKSLETHKTFLKKMKEQNLFTNVTSRFNLLRLGASAIKYTIWGTAAICSFVCRRIWKFLPGNFIGNAVGTDGMFRATSLQQVVPSTQASNESFPTSGEEKVVPATKEQQIEQRFRDLLWCLKPSGDLPDRKEGESASYEQAIRASKNRDISWRFAYEFRKCASIFSLDSIAEKVIIHFAATFKRYVRARKVAGDYDQERLACGFFGAEYRNMVNYVKSHYSKAAEQKIVEDVAKSISIDVINQLKEEQPGIFQEEEVPDQGITAKLG